MNPAPWSLRSSLTRTYLSLDARSLGLGRIVLGAVLLIDLLRRVPELVTWYTNQGLLPNHTVLWQPPVPRCSRCSSWCRCRTRRCWRL